VSRATEVEVVVITTVYPGVEPYLCRYLDSLEAQTLKVFDVLLANDGFIGLEAILSGRKLQWRILNVAKTLSGNRRDLINKAIEYGYKKIIFSDSDDELSLNRVDVLNSLLDIHDVVVNDLDIINSSSKLIDMKYLSNRFENGECINSIKLKSSNMMGLTNTAATSNALKNCIALQGGEALAFDWYLWSAVLLNSNEAIFTNKTTSKYRIHSSNVAGFPQPINTSSVLRGIEVKCEYYKLMSGISHNYDELANKFHSERNRLNNTNMLTYISILKMKKFNYPLWWEQIKLPSEVGIV
jgi:hypothetical protein